MLVGRGLGSKVSGEEALENRLIREAVTTQRRLTESEIKRIVLYVLTRPFSEHLVRAGPELEGLRWGDQVLTRNTRLPSSEQHLLKRTMIDLQWPPGISRDEYLEDLRRAIREAIEVYTYRYRGEDYMGFLADDKPGQLTAGAMPKVWVAYSATHGVLRTGFKVEGAFRPSGGSGRWYVFDHVVPQNLVRQR